MLSPKESETFHMVDGGIVTQNFALAAHALGLGTCWVGTMNRNKSKRFSKYQKKKYS